MNRSRASTGRARQRGVSLIFSLLGLAVLALAAVALIRSIDTGTLVLGNVGFKQDATASADQAVDQAVGWVQARATGTVLDANGATGSGYFAAELANLDPTGNSSSKTGRTVIDWEGDNCASYATGTYAQCVGPAAGTDVNGNKVKYLVERLCPNAGAANTGGNDCARPVTVGGGSDCRGSIDYRRYDCFGATTGGSAYFRVIVRVVGGKNAVSFTETVLHF